MLLKQFIKNKFLALGLDVGLLKQQLFFWREKTFEEAILLRKFFQLKKQKKGVMIDVGAHFGESFLTYLTKGWTVYAFEPDPHPKKKNALKCIKSPQLHLFDLAISNKAGLEVPFYASDESTGISSLSKFTAGHKFTKMVTTETLTSFISKEKIAEINFLKVDTEGHDLFVLQGFPWEMQKIFPDVILCEFEDSKTKPLGYSYNDLGDLLLEKGYSVYLSEYYPIETYGVKHNWRSINKYPCKILDDKGWGNYIALKQGDEILLRATLKSFGIEST